MNIICKGNDTMTTNVPKKIALLTDSCSDISPADLAHYNIHVVPLRILCEDGEYSDGVDITSSDIYCRLENGELPKTSLPTAGDINAVFDKIAAEGYDGVIAVILSGGLSGTYNLLRFMGQERRDLTVSVFDSLNGSMGQGLILLQLGEDINAGMSWTELTEKRVPQLIKNTYAFFSVDTLEYLHKGGRIGYITCVAGTLLKIKPVITFAEDGKLSTAAKVRGSNNLEAKFEELITEKLGAHRQYNLAIANGGAPEEAKTLRARITGALDSSSNIWEGEIGGTLSAHIGSGILGAAITILD